MKHPEFFKDNRKTNLNETNFKPSAIVKDLSIEEAYEFKAELSKQGVIHAVEIVTKTNRLFPDAKAFKSNSCKLFFETTESRNRMIKNKLLPDNKRFYVEQSIRISQCKTCKQFGHSAWTCKKEIVCARCGGDHDEAKVICKESFKCSNCGHNHSAFDRSCKVYLKCKSDQLNKIKKPNISSPPFPVRPSSSASVSHIN
jgi:hypothetical protein